MVSISLGKRRSILMWVLVFINIMVNASSGYNEPVIEGWYEYETMEECFYARELLFLDLGATDGNPPTGTQAVCINNGDE